MNKGEKIIYNGIEYTIWEIEETCVHLIDEAGNGICVLLTELNP